MFSDGSSANILKDERVGCYSLLVNHSIADYLRVARAAYKNKGGIEGQRPKLTTTTAIRIRKRMVDDMVKGAVMPPIVLGVVLGNEAFNNIEQMSVSEIVEIIRNIGDEHISIIDGMQRTTAILDAVERESEILVRRIRVEYWISDNANSLVYRMLVLNTGQVPWTLKRQIEVVFLPVIAEINRNVDLARIIRIDDRGRRTKPSEYSSADIIELFLAFGLRKAKVSTSEQLSDDFSRLDLIDASSNREYLHEFTSALQMLSNIDAQFSRHKPAEAPANRFKIGRNVFDSQPARIGFVTACAQYVFGRPGFERSEEEREEKLRDLLASSQEFSGSLAAASDTEVGEFLDLITLDELITKRKSGKVGDFERDFFLEAFRTLVDERFCVRSMSVCWRAF